MHYIIVPLHNDTNVHVHVYTYTVSLLDEAGGILCLRGQSPVVKHHGSKTSLNGVRESTSDTVEGEPRSYVA